MNTNREKEYIRQYNFKEAWKYSSLYSKMMYNYLEYKNLNKDEMFKYCDNIFKQFKGDLKRLDLIYKDNYKFVSIWNTFMNSINKNYSHNKIWELSNELHYTSLKNNL